MANSNLFLHICCAPCACYPVDHFRQNGFEVTGFWHNPNIHPVSEYELRRQALQEYRQKTGLEIIFDGEYRIEEWFDRTAPGWRTGDREKRCGLCYLFRMERTVAEAKKRGFRAFSTTLLYSRYQFHDRIAGICRELAAEHGLEFVYSDLRAGWQKGIEMSKTMGLYRQKFCGCLFSGVEARKNK